MIFTRVLAALLFFYAVPAHALSCAVPVFNAAAIEKTDIIFEGIVTDVEAPGFWQSLSKEKGMSVYKFKITKLWKGPGSEGDELSISAAPGWARDKAYDIGVNYMVFGYLKDGGYTASPGWCGFDILPRDEVIKTLESYKQEQPVNATH